jgi:hypothetical protein
LIFFISDLTLLFKRGKKVISFSRVFKYLSITIVSIITLFILFFYYTTNKPLEIPIYTLKNNNKEIIFVSAIHIGDESYYKEMTNTVNSSRDNGYTHLYEMVSASNEHDEDTNLKAKEKIKNSIGSIVNSYSEIAEKLNLVPQSNYIHLYVLDGDINADIDVVSLSKELSEGNSQVSKSNEDIKKILNADLNDFSKDLLKRVFKFIMSSSFDNKTFDEIKKMDENFRKIIDLRDKILFDKYMELNKDKIVITYGYAHFQGFFKLLKDNDPNWTIEVERKIIAIE